MTAPAYLGGKRLLAKWIVGLLPPVERGQLYVEPFAGMCSVLLARQPADQEIINDADELIVDWWRAVRDQPEEFQHLVDMTPHSRAELLRARKIIENPSSSTLLQRALAVHIQLTQSYGKSLKPGGWTRTFIGDKRPKCHRDILALSKRMYDVQFDCSDALELLNRVIGMDHAVVYLDPPYPSKQSYYRTTVDFDALARMLKDVNARCAISGYREDLWDDLGWVSVERNTTLVTRRHRTPCRRTECLWMNYEPTWTSAEHLPLHG